MSRARKLFAVSLGLLLLAFIQPALAVTAYVTFNTASGYLANGNQFPGEIIFFRSSVANAGNDYEAIPGRLTISGNVTNAAVDLGSTGGYFTAGFNNNQASSAMGCTTSPINYFTSTPNLASNATFNVTITCTTPNSAPTDITLSNATVSTTAGSNAVVGTLSATDADSGDTFTYSLVSGTDSTDNALFNISGNTLRVTNAAWTDQPFVDIRLP